MKFYTPRVINLQTNLGSIFGGSKKSPKEKEKWENMEVTQRGGYGVDVGQWWERREERNRKRKERKEKERKK